MEFLWDEQNTAHLARHGIHRELAEGIFRAADRSLFAADDDPGRFIVEGTISGRTYRLVFALSGPELIYPITAFRIAHERRRKE